MLPTFIATSAATVSVLGGLFAGSALGVYGIIHRKRIKAPDADARLQAWTPAARTGVVEEADVDAFIERLGDLQVADWLAIGRSIIKADDAAARSTARAILHATIGHERVTVDAWMVRDAVETAVSVHRVTTRRLSRSDRRDIAAAFEAAEDAALALRLRGRLAQADVETLCSPFERWIGTDSVLTNFP